MSTDTMIMLASVLIALSALFLSAYQARSLKIHNKLSVKPLLDFNYHSELGRKIMIHVTNGGLGPAILKEIKVKINGKEKDLNEQFWDSLLIKFKGEFSVRLYYLSGTDILQAKEERELLRIESKKPEEPLPADLEYEIDKICFVVTYISLYGQRLKAQSSIHRREPHNKSVATN